ncbi:potassium channel family protein [Buchananella hordeovulneris]|uniref:Trk system potassium uptake protein TrkA n=1 Tax=Buchananella hordeovulneris TaxID=52770 RepID=A0A1Q5PY72_9ACTO|nr:TrkA family potassium uptake protein [Buchananella hordeovulneris]MDO5080055.1 TrkA family potassium uptake protein [Buchananella hordeovulneris]OKL52487.1 potassium transporter TrkA [Buchananella hordeovulneris]RRD45320.1 TrkA family potassium uptake protein [Buchananella hordeovulneris]
MHIVIVGSGRVGATLAVTLEAIGHSVAIIDRSPEAFERLPDDFSGSCITGMAFDRDTLIRAGIEQAHGLAAVTSGDNSNILAARVARETFGVQQVVARIYDPRRADLYAKLGIPTVGTVRWSADRILHRLLPHVAGEVYRDDTGSISLCNPSVHRSWIGTPLSQLEAATGVRIAFVTRASVAHLPAGHEVFQEGDDLHLLVPVKRVEQVSRILGQIPQQED